MVNQADLKKRLEELASRDWDVQAIRQRAERALASGFRPKGLSRAELPARKAEILARVEARGAEYEYLTHSCSKGSALALMEEFGLGDLSIIRALSPFPGFGMTGGICGAVTGSLIGLGLYYGGDGLEDYEATGRTMTAARKFVARFKETFGTIMCPEIQEKVIFGRYFDPRASQENFEAFKKAQGYEKCALPPGLGARLAAEVIIESD